MKNKNISSIHFSLILFFISFASLSFSQNPDSCDLKFIVHLVDAGDYNEALYLLDSTDCALNSSNDSLNYLRGWSLYSLKRLSASSEYLMKVSQKSELYPKSHFFSAYNFAHSGDTKNALGVLSTISPKTEKQNSLRNYLTAGIYLLQRDTIRYRESFAKTNRSFYEISESSDNLQKISTDLKNHKSRSPVIAGILSGIIPGSGKFYAGKKGEAISAFIATTGLGLVTWENYRKNGLANFRTIAFGTAFAFSYTANIYGAVMTVNIIETEYGENVKNSILFNLHIPLRNIFDK
jgi:hypothetical protein